MAANYRFLQRSMCPPRANMGIDSGRTASWTVVLTTFTVQLTTRQPDMNNIQKSEPRAKRKPGDGLCSARFGAEVKQTAAVSCAEEELGLVREVKVTDASCGQSQLAEVDATSAANDSRQSAEVGRTSARKRMPFSCVKMGCRSAVGPLRAGAIVLPQPARS